MKDKLSKSNPNHDQKGEFTSGASLVTGHVPGSDAYKAMIAHHQKHSEELGHALVSALNKETKAHGTNYPLNIEPVDPKIIAARLAEDEG